MSIKIVGGIPVSSKLIAQATALRSRIDSKPQSTSTPSASQKLESFRSRLGTARSGSTQKTTPVQTAALKKAEEAAKKLFTSVTKTPVQATSKPKALSPLELQIQQRSASDVAKKAVGLASTPKASVQATSKPLVLQPTPVVSGLTISPGTSEPTLSGAPYSQQVQTGLQYLSDTAQSEVRGTRMIEAAAVLEAGRLRAVNSEIQKINEISKNIDSDITKINKDVATLNTRIAQGKATQSEINDMTKTINELNERIVQHQTDAAFVTDRAKKIEREVSPRLESYNKILDRSSDTFKQIDEGYKSLEKGVDPRDNITKLQESAKEVVGALKKSVSESKLPNILRAPIEKSLESQEKIIDLQIKGRALTKRYTDPLLPRVARGTATGAAVGAVFGKGIGAIPGAIAGGIAAGAGSIVETSAQIGVEKFLPQQQPTKFYTPGMRTTIMSEDEARKYGMPEHKSVQYVRDYLPPVAGLATEIFAFAGLQKAVSGGLRGAAKERYIRSNTETLVNQGMPRAEALQRATTLSERGIVTPTKSVLTGKIDGGKITGTLKQQGLVEVPYFDEIGRIKYSTSSYNMSAPVTIEKAGKIIPKLTTTRGVLNIDVSDLALNKRLIKLAEDSLGQVVPIKTPVGWIKFGKDGVIREYASVLPSKAQDYSIFRVNAAPRVKITDSSIFYRPTLVGRGGDIPGKIVLKPTRLQQAFEKTLGKDLTQKLAKPKTRIVEFDVKTLVKPIELTHPITKETKRVGTTLTSGRYVAAGRSAPKELTKSGLKITSSSTKPISQEITSTTYGRTFSSPKGTRFLGLTGSEATGTARIKPIITKVKLPIDVTPINVFKKGKVIKITVPKEIKRIKETFMPVMKSGQIVYMPKSGTVLGASRQITVPKMDIGAATSTITKTISRIPSATPSISRAAATSGLFSISQALSKVKPRKSLTSTYKELSQSRAEALKDLNITSPKLKTIQQTRQDYLQRKKLSTDQIKALDKKSATDLQQAQITATTQSQAQRTMSAQAQTSIQAQLQAQAQKTRTAQRSRLITPVATPTAITPTTPILPPFFDIDLDPKPIDLKKLENITGGWDVKVKEAGKLVKVTDKPLNYISALNKGITITDNTKAATFKLVKSSRKGTHDEKRTNIRNISKFRRPKSGERDIYVELEKYRIDSRGELKGITAKGWKSPDTGRPTKRGRPRGRPRKMSFLPPLKL